ncbi:hypothetical protein I6E74_09935 [Salinibacterium sp. SWN139]|uniref:hypothetical protein n=1 Tax=Salinibacterium sp. SWN139 TaxID=2792055 RepID=UPI0018CDC272|nr:hypothetical protein [Salinibacterium sp. SWN139]MBH0054484.1 hypothetical protein [Salinibacterium sp. SWN139]
MASNGRISILLSKDLQTLLSAVRQIPKEVAAEVRKQTKAAAFPIWGEEVRGRTASRQQVSILSDTARVAVSDSNVLLKSAAVGKTSNGVPKSLLATGTEFGGNPNKVIHSRTKAGKPYTRKQGKQFPLPRRGGYVVYPAARDSIPRLASLWVQTTVRTIHEALEKGGVR